MDEGAKQHSLQPYESAQYWFLEVALEGFVVIVHNYMLSEYALVELTSKCMPLTYPFVGGLFRVLCY